MVAFLFASLQAAKGIGMSSCWTRTHATTKWLILFWEFNVHIKLGFEVVNI